MLDIVIGMQFGSEGKGSVCQHLASQRKYDAVVRLGGPNSGHTSIYNGQLVKLRQLPTAWFTGVPIIIPASGVIDPDVFDKEIRNIRELMGKEPVIYVASTTSVISHEDIMAEGGLNRLGSTQTGTGAARAAKIMRRAVLAKDHPVISKWVNDREIRMMLNNKFRSILVEGMQGFGLSVDYQYYPYCTSVNNTPKQYIADLGLYVHPHHAVAVYGVARIFPIRVGGTSGPMYQETTWAEIRLKYGDHVPVEHTTVTNHVRRVGLFDDNLWRDALDALRPHEVFLTFCDYIAPELHNKSGIMQMEQIPNKLLQYIKTIPSYNRIGWMGTGIGTFIKIVG